MGEGCITMRWKTVLTGVVVVGCTAGSVVWLGASPPGIPRAGNPPLPGDMQITLSPTVQEGRIPLKTGSGEGEFTIHYRNTSKRPVYLRVPRPDYADQRVLLFDGNGVLVPNKSPGFTAAIREARETASGHPPVHRIISEMDIHLAPGEEFTAVLRLGDWYTVTHPGIYRVVVVRRFSAQGLDISVSNMATIKIEKE